MIDFESVGTFIQKGVSVVLMVYLKDMRHI